MRHNCVRPTTEAQWKKAAIFGTWCIRCKKCLHCHGCACSQCIICKIIQKPSKFCQRCLRCREHHTEQIFRLGDFPFRKCTYTKDFPSTYTMNSLHRGIGVEIELEKVNGLTQADCINIQFAIEADGSVHGDGKELVTEKLYGDKYLIGMTDLVNAISKRGCIAGPTAGFHVHIDAIDYAAIDLRRAFVVFTLIQNQLFSTLVQNSRRFNTYCPPIDASQELLERLISMTKAIDINRFFYKYLYNIEYSQFPYQNTEIAEVRLINRNIKEAKARKYFNQARRQALNFHSYMMRGTLEFRLHEGTTNPESLLMWPLWCGWFVQKMLSSEFSDKEVSYWVAKGAPSLVEITERFTRGRYKMPTNILDWVKRRTKETVDLVQQAPAQPVAGTVDVQPLEDFGVELQESRCGDEDCEDCYPNRERCEYGDCPECYPNRENGMDEEESSEGLVD